MVQHLSETFKENEFSCVFENTEKYIWAFQ